MTNDDDTDKSAYKGSERRKQVRRSGNDRRERVRGKSDNPPRRKGHGRRASD